ncbi:transporter [Bradyrhizobium manausense]|uniref:SphA family protein n=1 Tax=Bradyrhizobium manausense TaxID=989370 RepID=UPI001BACC9A6|nr:transporter [Bradyrhizobium manausense]MBR0831519.1 transporter [Bradyrhizobium manausense]
MQYVRSGRGRSFSGRFGIGTLAALLALSPQIACADEGGVSFWVPGLYGSLAAVPQQAPGWSATTIYWHDSVSAGGDVARARQITIGNIPANVTATANASVHANLDVGFLIANYAFETPVFGGQASAGFLAAYGANSTSLAGTLTGTVTTPGGTFPFSRSDSINSSIMGFGDVYPQFTLKWNAGVNNYMTYITGDIPVGAYDSARLANIGIGHWAIDAGGGYTYFDQKTGREASAVLGFTYNFKNPATQYQNGVDMHLDWGASQFLTKQWQVGLVGYLYQEIGCDSGSGDRVGCFRSRVQGIGPQVGYIFPVGDMQGYLNLKAYGEFANANRPDGWNVWLTFNLSPAAATPPTSSRPRFTK